MANLWIAHPARVWTSVALLVAVGFGSFYWSRVDAKNRSIPGGDTTIYVLLARSIKEHGELRSTWTVGEPLHGKLAPGLPVLLVPFLTPDGLNTGAARALIVATAAGALFVMFLLFRHGGELQSLGLSVLTGQSLLIYLYGRSILSEIPYMFLSLVALVLWDRYERFGCSSRRDESLLAIVLATAFFTRTLGVFLIGSIWVRLILVLGRAGIGAFARRKVLFWGLAGVVILWFFRQYGVSHLSDQTYLDDFVTGRCGSGSTVTALPGQWLRGVYALAFYLIPQALVNIHFTYRTLVAFALSLVFIAGLLRSLIIQRRAMDIYVAFFLVGVAGWPWVHTSGLRLITPLVPFVFYYFWQGLRPMNRWDWAKPVIAAAAILVTGTYCWHGPLGVRTTPAPVAAKDDLPWLYAWVKTNIPTGDVIVSYEPAAMFLQTGRRSPDYNVTTVSGRKLVEIFAAGKAQWYVDDERFSGFADMVKQLAEQTPPLLKLAFRVGPYAVYRWQGGGTHDSR